MVLDEQLFGPAPESFKAVDVYFPTFETLLMINQKVTITAKHERIVCLVTVDVNDASTPNCLDGYTKKGFGANVWNGLHPNDSLTLHDTEYRDFTGCAATALAFPAAAEITLVKLDLTTEQDLGILGIAKDRVTEQRCRPVYGIIRQCMLRGNLVYGYLQLEQLAYPQPVLAA